MNAKQLNRIFARAMYSMVIVAMVFSMTGNVSAQEPAPFLVAFPEWESVEGYGYPLGVGVRLEIDDPSTEDITPDYSAVGTVVETGWGGNYVKFNFWGEDGYDLKTDDLVSLIYNGESLTHRVRNLSVTNVDVETDSVMGMADSGEEVFVNTYDDWGVVITIITESSGSWTVNNGLNLEYNSGGRSQIYDGFGNSTAVDWSTPPPPPNPHFYVFPEWDYIIGWEWPAGNFVTAEVYHPSDDEPACTATVEVVHPEWSEDVYVAEFFPVETCDIQTDDHVVLTDGQLSRDHIVFPLQVTMFDQEINTIGGFGEPGIEVQAWIHEEDGTFRTVLPDDDGNWVVDFNPFDLVIGMGGRVEQYDDDGNATSVDWYLPKPRFTVYPEWEAVEARDWPADVLVTAVVSGNEEICTTDGYPVADPSGTNVWMNFPEVCDVMAGNEVVLSAVGVPDVSHIVQNLLVTAVNEEYDTVAGTADEGVTVYVWPHGFGEYEVQPTADGGFWLADFSGFGEDILLPGMDGRSEVRDDYGNSTAVDWHILKPRFTVYPEWDAVEAWDWPADVLVTASVIGNEDNCTTDGYPIADPWGTNVWMNFPEGCDVVLGNEVFLSAEGVAAVSHTVRNLSVTEVNADAETVAGTADEGEMVYVWPHGFGEYEVQPTAGGDNVWVADFSGFGDVLQPGMDGRSEVRDDYGNATAVDWHAPNPWFTVFPEQNAVEGWDWPLDAVIHMTIDDPNTLDITLDYWQDEPMVVTPWDPESGATWVWFDFADAYNIKPGDVVTLSLLDDGTMERTHEVQYLSISEIDSNENTVFGTADDGHVVTLWSWEDPAGRRIETDGSENWVVDFDDIGFDLEPGYHVRAEVWIGGNDTAVDRYITNPRFTVFPEWEWFDGLDWPDGSTVLITVQGKDECTTEGTSWDYFFNGGFPEDCNVAIGDNVTFTDGETIRTHTVQNLSVTKVEPGNDIVKGTADAGEEIHVWPHATGQEQIATTNPKGKWSASFLGIYDLMPGDGGRAEIRDEIGNATAVDWYIPNPRIVASITEDWFFLQEFSPNKAISFTVYTTQSGKPIWQGTATTDDSGFVWVDAEGRWDLEPGNYLFARDGSNSKGLVIEGFTFDVFDLAYGQLSGTAPEPYGRNVWVGIGWEDHVWDMQVATDEAGAWFADFGQPVPADYQWVAAQIFDEDGDSTELRPDQVINLWVAAFTFVLPTGTFTEDGAYPYHFELEWSFPEDGSWSGQDGELSISSEAELYDGYVLLRGTRELRGVNDPEGLSCEEVFEVNPDQSMRFLFGWVTDYGMTFDDALAHFESMTARVIWDDGNSAELTRHEVMQFSFNDVDAWLYYACLFSANFILPANAGWMDSGIDVTAGTEITISAYGEAATGDLAWYPNSFSGPDGQDGLGCGDYEAAPPPCALDYGPYGALIGRIGIEGEPFFIGSNLTFTPTASGELYLAVNDNLIYYEDNSGGYGIFIE